MKKLVLLTVLVFTMLSIFAEYEWIDPQSPSYIVSDPSVTYEVNRPINVMEVKTLEVSPEMEFNSGRQTIKLPLAYPISMFVLGANVPLVRSTVTFGDKSKSAIGMGDMAISAAYSSNAQLSGYNVDYAADVSVKLPTGDYEKTIKVNSVKMPAPTGTGSLDMTFSGNAILANDAREIFADVKYRLNGKNEDDYKNGNLLSIKGKYGFLQFEPKFDGYVAALAMIGSKGDADGAEVENGFFLLDVIPELHYKTKYGMFKAGVSIPMITSAETKFTREVSVRFGLSKQY